MGGTIITVSEFVCVDLHYMLLSHRLTPLLACYHRSLDFLR